MKKLILSLLFVSLSISGNAFSVEETIEELEDGKRIEIRVDADEFGDIESEIKSVISVVKKIVGEDLAKELEEELSDLTDKERKKLHNEFRSKIVRLNDHGNGVGVGEVLIATTAIIFTLGMPVIILLLVFFFSHRKRRQKLELINSYLNANQPVPDHVMAEFAGTTGTKTPLRSGLILVGIGLGLGIFLSMISGPDVGAVALIPLFIGLARIVHWYLEGKNLDLDGEKLQNPR